MKITTMRRGDKDYVYLYTSRRVRGKKNPDVIKRYVGILDERTGLVTPKKVPPETFLASIHDGEFTCKELGNILIARKVAETLGIPEYLDRTFGENSKIIYALILAIAVNPLYSSDYTKYVSKYYLDDIVVKETLTAKDINQALSDFQSRISSAYFGTHERTRRLVFMLGNTSYGGDPIERMSNKEYARWVPERVMFIVTDDEGDPLFLRSSASGMSASESLRKAAAHANFAGGTNTFVLGTLSPETMMAMVNGGVHFVSDADHMLYDDDVLNRLTHDLGDDWTIREYGSDSYHVLEAGLGIYREGNGLRTKIGRADGMSDALAVLRMSAWFDQKEFERLLKDITTVTNRKVDALRSMSLESARNHLMDGSMESQFISVSEGDDGGIRVKVQKKKRRQMALAASTHIMVSDHMSWEEGMHCLMIERDIVAHSRPIADVVLNRKKWSGYSYSFLALAAMMIRMHLEKMFNGYGKRYASVEEIFQIASTYTIVNVNGHLYRSRMTKEVESMFEFLGIDVEDPISAQSHEMTEEGE